MRNFFKNKPILVTIVAVVLLIILAASTSGDRTASFFENIVGGIVKPIQSAGSSLTGGITGFFERIFSSSDADKENEQLRIKNENLERQMQSYEEMRLENERLKELLNFVTTSVDYEYVGGRVIGASTNKWFGVFTVNIGRNNGVEENMTVVNSEGVVGRVIEVGASWCKVASIIDSSTSMSVIVQRTRDNCMVRGALNEQSGDDNLFLYYLASNNDLVPGDAIVTSGIGENVPKGLKVGTVKEVLRTNDDSRQSNAIITPAVDFEHIEEVLIITGVKEQQ